MKLQELREGAESTAEKITKGLSGIKGVKVSTQIADYDDLDGNELIQAYLVKVTYTPSRGVKPSETIKVYKTTDGDWEYLSDSGGGGDEVLGDALAALRKDIEVAQKFHGKSSKVDEGTPTMDDVKETQVNELSSLTLGKASDAAQQRSKLLRLTDLDDTAEFEEERAEKFAQGMTKALARELVKSSKTMPGKLGKMLRAELKNMGIEESVVTEGYEMKVLKAAEADGVRGCFFRGGKLFCDKPDLDRVVKLLKKAEAKGEFDMPEVVAVKD